METRLVPDRINQRKSILFGH